MSGALPPVILELAPGHRVTIPAGRSRQLLALIAQHQPEIDRPTCGEIVFHFEGARVKVDVVSRLPALRVPLAGERERGGT